MDPGNPADLLLYCLTLYRPTAQAVVRLNWPLPKFRAPIADPFLLAIHAGHIYDYREARRIAQVTGEIMPAAPKCSIGIVGLGRWDGTRLLDLAGIECLYVKGRPGLWSLGTADEQTVRERYAATLAKKAREPITIQPGHDWDA